MGAGTSVEVGGAEAMEETLETLARLANADAETTTTTEEGVVKEEGAVAGGEKFRWKLSEEVARRLRWMEVRAAS